MNVKQSKTKKHPFEDYAPAPYEDPLIYPGKWPDWSFLYVNLPKNKLFEVIEIFTQKNRKLNHSEVRIRNYYYNIGKYLRDINEPVIAERIPVLTYGSNNCPRQLYLKRVIGAVPVIKARLIGFDVVYSAHMSRRGYIPAALIESEGTEINVFVALFDEVQLEIINQTEGRPEVYELVKIDFDGKRRKLVLENGEILSYVYTYVSKKGILAIDEKPIALQAIIAKNRKFMQMDEKDILSEIMKKLCVDMKAAPPISDLCPWELKNIIDLIRNKKHIEMLNIINEVLRKRYRLETNLARKDYVTIIEAATKDSEYLIKRKENDILRVAIKPYIDIPIRFENLPRMFNELQIIPTARRDHVKGDYIIRLNEEIAKKLGFCNCIFHRILRRIGFNDYVAIVNDYHRSEKHDLGKEFSTFGILVIDNSVKNGQVAVDLSLRHSIGLSRYEYAKFYKVKVDFKWRLRNMLAKLFGIQYTIARVRKGDVTDVEKNICRAEKQIFDDIGISNNDFCVIEHLKRDKDESYRIKSIRLRALELIPEIKKSRTKIQIPLWKARFPDCQTLLGIAPEIAWILLDIHAREELGVNVCGAVRIRRSISHELSKRLSEFAFVLLLTILGAILTYGQGDIIQFGSISIKISLLLFLIFVVAILLIALEIRRQII